jgi:hypothetical protein
MKSWPPEPEQLRKVIWLVDSRVRLTGFPPPRFGTSSVSHLGRRGSVKTMTARRCCTALPKLSWRVRADDPGGTYRAVYVAQLWEAVYVLHAFQKKATPGIATPQRKLDLIRQRLQLARKLAGK